MNNKLSMKIRIKIAVLAFIALISCSGTEPFKSFPPEALAQQVTEITGESVSMKDVLDKYQGKTIVLDVWASWCKDCITGMPKLKALQANPESKDVVFMFLSMDKSREAWLNGISRFNVTGEHYYIGNDWKAPFNKAIGLDWIPRYMVIGKDGSITLFKATKADDQAILDAIKE